MRIAHYSTGRLDRSTRLRGQLLAAEKLGIGGVVVVGGSRAERVFAGFDVLRRRGVRGVFGGVVSQVWSLGVLWKLARSGVSVLHVHENSSLFVGVVWLLVFRGKLVYDPHDIHLVRVRDDANVGNRLSWWVKRRLLEPYVVRRSRAVLHVSGGAMRAYQSVYRECGNHRLLPSMLPDIITAPELDGASRRARASKNLREIRLVYFGPS